MKFIQQLTDSCFQFDHKSIYIVKGHYKNEKKRKGKVFFTINSKETMTNLSTVEQYFKILTKIGVSYFF